MYKREGVFMGKDGKINKKPVAEHIIFRNMMVTVFAVATLFFLKNLIGQAWRGGQLLLAFV
jgi:hypothetical protein